METLLKLSKLKEAYSVEGNVTKCNVTYKIVVNSSIPMDFGFAIEEKIGKIFRKYHKCSKDLVFNITSTATCSESDSFDETVGKKLAHSKNETTAYLLLSRATEELGDFLTKLEDMAIDFYNKIAVIVERECDYQDSFE